MAHQKNIFKTQSFETYLLNHFVANIRRDEREVLESSDGRVFDRQVVVYHQRTCNSNETESSNGRHGRRLVQLRQRRQAAFPIFARCWKVEFIKGWRLVVYNKSWVYKRVKTSSLQQNAFTTKVNIGDNNLIKEYFWFIGF